MKESGIISQAPVTGVQNIKIDKGSSRCEPKGNHLWCLEDWSHKTPLEIQSQKYMFRVCIEGNFTGQTMHSFLRAELETGKCIKTKMNYGQLRYQKVNTLVITEYRPQTSLN